ncbi:hypothetical protein ANO11243_088740 [Dothideomycetidae sp. 11243]|nr:hypothetical protein ANO11243_088740 [fungal sp. No.11243]
MRASTVIAAVAAISTVSAQDFLQKRDDCQKAYNVCISAGNAQVLCSCQLATCSGEDDARERAYCATATASLTASQTTSTTASTASSTAPTGTLPLGAKCSASTQCANGAQCYGQTAGTITTCGSFNAACTTDSQCATNTCNNGICSGLLKSSSPSLTTSSALSKNTTIVTITTSCTSTTTSASGTGSYHVGPTTSVVAFTGGAAQTAVGAVLALVAGAFAFAL